MISPASLLVGVSEVGRIVVAALCATILLRAHVRPRWWLFVRGAREFVYTLVLFFFLFASLVAAIHGGSR